MNAAERAAHPNGPARDDFSGRPTGGRMVLLGRWL